MSVNNTMKIGDTVFVEYTGGSSKLLAYKSYKGIITTMARKEEQFVMLNRSAGFKLGYHRFFTTRMVLIEKYK